MAGILTAGAHEIEHLLEAEIDHRVQAALSSLRGVAERGAKRAFAAAEGFVGIKKMRPAGILAMMTAEPGMMMEAGMDPIDRQLALQGHNIQQYSELVNMQASGFQPRAVWVQLNLAKHQALLVQRIRVTTNGTTLQQLTVGLRWGRPAAPLGTGAPGHLSAGIEFDLPLQSGVTDAQHAVMQMADVTFTSDRATSGGTAIQADPSIQEVNLAPNFVLIRSYTIMIGGSGIASDPFVNFFGKIVNLDFGNILSVRS